MNELQIGATAPEIPEGTPALIQCVPNFSEGSDPGILGCIADAISGCAGVRLVDWSADPDHNRSVFTFLGGEDAVAEAAIAAAGAAVQEIDLRAHHGVHPRMGAMDVLPFVPVAGISLLECAALSRRVGQEIATRYDVPVFFYEAASETARTLPFLRKHAFAEIMPDIGGRSPHPTAGALIAGARMPLIAFNVNLDTDDIRLARSIARSLRAAFPDQVRALGLRLSSQERAQVSTNIVRTDLVNPWMVMQFVSQHAAVHSTELIGVMPGRNMLEAFRDSLRMPGLRSTQVLLETWLPGNR